MRRAALTVEYVEPAGRSVSTVSIVHSVHVGFTWRSNLVKFGIKRLGRPKTVDIGWMEQKSNSIKHYLLPCTFTDVD